MSCEPASIGGSVDGSSTGRASIGLATPANAAVNDVLVASVATNADGTMVPVESGWTVVRDDQLSGAVRQTIYVRPVTSAAA